MICLLFVRYKTISLCQFTKMHEARLMKSHVFSFIIELDSLIVLIYNSNFILRLSWFSFGSIAHPLMNYHVEQWGALPIICFPPIPLQMLMRSTTETSAISIYGLI